MTDEAQEKKDRLAMKLRLMRNKRGLTQDECATAVQCRLRQWSRWEKAESYPQYVYRKDILDLFPQLRKL